MTEQPNSEGFWQASIDTALGTMLASGNARALCALEFSDKKILPSRQNAKKNEILERLQAELREYFSGSGKKFDIPLEIDGSPFQKRVWEALLRIPYGETISYAELARWVDKPKASRAVGQANGKNRIAILIPCHRVINSGGSLGGYAGGTERKRLLLEIEKGEAKPSSIDQDIGPSYH